MATAPRPDGFRGEFLWELEITTRQNIALAEAFPAEKYNWRPDAKARSVSEVFVHVSAGIFMLLDILGIPAPADLYGNVPPAGHERMMGLIHKNDELEAGLKEKGAVVAMLKRALQAAHDGFTRASDSELERRHYFFNQDTSVRRVYLRLLAHTHEHMGQMIAYLRFNGLPAPWQDWRPDRRAES